MATIGILQERAIRRGEVVNEQLQTALNSRVVIEQAKGVLAERGAIAMDVAFDRLRRHSRRTNQRLSRVARRIVERELDPDAVLETLTAPWLRPCGVPAGAGNVALKSPPLTPGGATFDRRVSGGCR